MIAEKYNEVIDWKDVVGLSWEGRAASAGRKSHCEIDKEISSGQADPPGADKEE